MKRRRLSCLALVLLVAVLASCAGDVPPPTPGTKATSATQQDPVPGPEPAPGPTPGPEPDPFTPYVEPKEEDKLVRFADLVAGTPLYAEAYRQQFHYSPKDSWMNDINGLVYFKGVYHMYYQNNPGTVVCDTGVICWGHATSTDLIHWEEQPIALRNGQEGGIWSGTAWADTENRSGLFEDGTGGGIIAAYSTHKQKIGIAYSTDGTNYTKLGIVIDNTTIKDFRDPKIFWDTEAGKWTLVVAGGQVMFYQSSDLRNWEKVSENNIWTECPDFFPMTVEGTDTVKWVLSCAGRGYYIGSYANGTFTPETGYITPITGPDYYAAITYEGIPDGRRLMCGWMDTWTYAQQTATDWCSNASMTSELTLVRENGEYRICFAPAAEYASLELGDLVKPFSGTLTADDDPLAGIQSGRFVLDMTVDLANTTDFRLGFRMGTEDSTYLSYTKEKGKVTFDRSENVAGVVTITEEYPTYEFAVSRDGKTARILVYVDTAGVEIYTNGGEYFAALIRPLASSKGLTLRTDGTLAVTALTVRALDTIWFDDPAEVAAAHIAQPSLLLALEGATSAVLPACSYGGQKPVHYEADDPNIVSLEAVEGGVRVTAKGVGKTTLRAIVWDRYVTCEIEVCEKITRASAIGTLTAENGHIELRPDGFLFVGNGGDAFAMANATYSDFVYEADLAVRPNGVAAALTFRQTGTSDFYCVCLDSNAGVVKLWLRDNWNVRDVRTASLTIVKNKVYHMKIEAVGSTITVWVNGNKMMEVTDTTHTSGTIGINTYNGEGLFNNMTCTAK